MELGGYRILDVVAQGGMGVVYRAYDLALQREVALKTLRVHDPVVRQRFRRECEALAQSRHPNVMPCYAAGEHEGQPYLVLPLVRGETLATRLRRGPLPVTEAVRVGARLADALAFLHDRGVLHRDLKPDNVLFDEQDEPLIADFGLVKLEASAQPLERLTVSGAMLGTPEFWPPEQALGQVARIGPASDVYGLGATLYCALSGRPPQPAESLSQLVEALEREPPPLVGLRPEVPPSLAQLVHDCLARAPETRPSAAEVARALHTGSRGSGGAIDYAAPPRGGRLVPALGLLALAAALGLGGWWATRGAPAPAPPVETVALEPEPPTPPPWRAALDEGDYAGLAARAQRGAFDPEQLVALREAVLRQGLSLPPGLTALRAQLALLVALREAGAPAYPWTSRVGVDWGGVCLFDPRWRGAETEGRLLAEAFSAAVIGDAQARGPYQFAQPPLFPEALPGAPLELIEGLRAAGLPLGDRWSAELLLNFVEASMHPLTDPERWRLIAALLDLGALVHMEELPRLEDQPEAFAAGTPAERMLYALARLRDEEVAARAVDEATPPAVRVYAAWWLVERGGDPARWAPVLALDPGWVFSAFALAKALQATAPDDPRIEGLLRWASERALDLQGLPLHMADTQLTRGFFTWPRCTLWAEGAVIAAAHGWRDLERANLARVRAVSEWRYLVAGLQAAQVRGDLELARRLVREGELEESRAATFLSHARTPKDEVKRTAELEEVRRALRLTRELVARLEAR